MSRTFKITTMHINGWLARSSASKYYCPWSKFVWRKRRLRIIQPIKLQQRLWKHKMALCFSTDSRWGGSRRSWRMPPPVLLLSTPITPASSSTSLPTQSLAPPKPPRFKWMRRFFGKSKSSQSPSQASLVSTSTSVTPSASTTPKEASFRQRLTWPSTLDDIGDDLERIDRFKATVNLILTAGSPEYA
jgi:hypothetical protein